MLNEKQPKIFHVIILTMRKSVKILTATVCSAVVIAGFGVGTYLYTLPKLVSSAWLNKVAVKEATECLKADLSIKNPKLATSLSPNIGFTLEELTLTKNNKQILVLNNLDTEFSFKDIWAKRIIVKKLLADNIFVNTSDLPTLYLTQTLRSGQTVSYEGNIFIIGDVHPGSEVNATGDVTVWGILGGIVHAGSEGNTDAKVRALKLNPIQLRIANLYSRRNDTINVPYVQKSNEFTPEEARIDKNQIVIYKTLRRED